MLVKLVDQHNSCAQVYVGLVTQYVHVCVQLQSIRLRLQQGSFPSDVFVMAEHATANVPDVGKGAKFSIREGNGKPVVEQQRVFKSASCLDVVVAVHGVDFCIVLSHPGCLLKVEVRKEAMISREARKIQESFCRK